MCLGNTTTEVKQQQSTPNPWVANAATQNLVSAEQLQATGFVPYTGQTVADFSPQQTSSFAMGNALANAGVPQVGTAENAVGNAAGVGPQSVNAESIASNMDPYMNQYVSKALAPQIAAQDIQFADQNRADNAAATSSGAFGDARAGIQTANTRLNQDIARTGLVGQAYTNAFNTAIGAGAQDVSNKLAAGTTNANLANTWAQQQLGVAGAAEALGGYQVGQGTNLTNLQNSLGSQQTQQDQARRNAALQMWMMGQQYPFLTSQNLNQTISAGANAMPASVQTTTQKPNNSLAAILGGALPSIGSAIGSGIGSLGSLIGGAGSGAVASAADVGGAGVMDAAMMAVSDERVKVKKGVIATTKDGIPVHAFRYLDDPENVTRIGFMAQEVEPIYPEAVAHIGDLKVIDYGKATEFARNLGLAEAA